MLLTSGNHGGTTIYVILKYAGHTLYKKNDQETCVPILKFKIFILFNKKTQLKFIF